MKNLQLVNFDLKKLPKNPCQVTVNEDVVYFIKENKLYKFYNCIETLLSNDTYNCLTPLEFLQFENRLWFGTGHEFISYCSQSNTILTIPLEDEYLCATWNPTQEVLAVVFANSKVATFNIDYETGIALPINQSSLHASVPQTVYVGWGSANTQFRGSEGKLKPDTKTEVKIIQDRLPRITWRGNGEMFAVNYWHDGKRTFKVFELPCTPIFECEDMPGLQCPIAWRPEGNMIANPVCVDGKTSICIFEKNGYKRFQFPINFCNDEVKDLKWSPGGEILTILQELQNGDSSVCLYTSSNYKWYLKQHLRFPKQIVSFDWTNVFTLRITTTSEIVTYTFKHVVHTKDAIVAVIDGPHLQLTDFKNSIIPPPMSEKKLTVNNPINFVAIQANGRILATIDSAYQIKVFEYVESDWREIYTKQINVSAFPLGEYHFHWQGKKLCYVTAADYSVVGFEIGKENDAHFYESIAANVSEIQAENFKLYQMQNILKLNETEVILQDSPIKIAAYEILNSNPFVFALTRTNGFYINNKMVANNVTSFTIHDKYLLLTTTQNRICCIRLINSQIEKLKMTSLNEDFFSRPIEQGGLIICGIPNTSNVVLQIPRGNLEVISIRLIAIDILEALLDKNEWKEAINLIRTDRLNFNLLIDLNPDRFRQSIEKFVDACETAAALNSFCQEIDDANVLTTIYQKCWSKQIPQLQNKCKVVCTEILNYLQSTDYTNYITTIMIINVYHFSIEDALVYVQDLLYCSKATAELAVKTLSVHAKREDLFLKSLSLYDIELTKFVAGYSQMDPKSYEPFLNELSELTEARKRFKINIHLKKFNIAIKYLLKSEDVTSNEVLEFIKTHDVVEIAYKNLTNDSPIFKDVSSLLGEKLAKKSLHIEAGIVYALAELWIEAYQQYKQALDWQRAISCLNETNLSELEKYRMIQEIVDELIQKRKIKDAARVSEEYLKNYEAAINILIDGYVFNEAIFIAKKYKRPDVIEADILPAIKRYFKTLMLKILEATEAFEKYKTRLEIVRNERTAKYKNVGMNHGDDDILDDGMNVQQDIDLFSDAGSQATTKSTRTSGSRMSTVSSRNRRKEERKKQDLREGGVYEDIALIRALYNLITEISEISSDVRDICHILFETNLTHEAQVLQDLFKSIDEKVRNNIKEIWPDTFNEHQNSDKIEERAINENILVLDEKYRKPPDLGETNWFISFI